MDGIDTRWVALLALALQIVAVELGWRAASRAAVVTDASRAQATAVQASVLALLGLLLAFTFSMSAARFEARRELVVAEANALGTAHLRAGLASEDARGTLRGLLVTLAAARLDYLQATDETGRGEALRASDHALRHLALTTEATVRAAPQDVGRALLVPAINALSDLEAQQVAAHEARVPGTIVALLVVLSVVAMGLVGWCFGLHGGAHRGPCGVLVVLLALILLVILDLDDPRHGRIRVRTAPLVRASLALTSP